MAPFYFVEKVSFKDGAKRYGRELPQFLYRGNVLLTIKFPRNVFAHLR
jgi:hypothetical protein